MDELTNNFGETFQQDRYPLANPRHRFGGAALDGLLMMVTFGFGWMIWSLVLWGQGQTPAKQILKMRVMDYKSKRPASWGQMAIRQFLLPAVPSALIGIAYVSWIIRNESEFGSVVPAGGYLGALIALYGLLLIHALTDALWVLREEKRRLTDYYASTYVVNEAAVNSAHK